MVKMGNGLVNNRRGMKMDRSAKGPMQRVYRGEPGFTLIEMMVVVGIIAVLAAVIIPNIGKFIGSGVQGPKTWSGRRSRAVLSSWSRIERW